MGLVRVADIAAWMENFAPANTAESWDNVGLLLGDMACEVPKLMTCLTITWQTVDEAIDSGAKLLLSHHPCPFKPIQKITTLTATGEHLWRLANHGISVYSPHTAFDSAKRGINQQWLEKLDVEQIQALIPATTGDIANIASLRSDILGSGRWGSLTEPVDLAEFLERIRRRIPGCHLRGVDQDKPVQRVAVGCGSGAGFLSVAHRVGCDTFITGEATFHQCLEAEHLGMNLILVGHYASERFAVEWLAERLASEFPTVNAWASRKEADPLSHWL